jgi:ribonuclease PH
MAELKSFDDLKIMVRSENRGKDALRSVTVTPDYVGNATASVLIECGRTRVICAASIQNKIPRWMMNEKRRTGWLTAEYRLLPYAGNDRKARECSMGRISGRTHEIQRLIGRSLRGAVDLEKLGERTIWIDCDVIEADGGTRTASVTGGYIALAQAIDLLLKKKTLKENPLVSGISAVSVGIVDNTPVLDLDYREDFAAEVDLNVVMTHSGDFIEVQGTAEGIPLSRSRLDDMLALAEKGCKELRDIQIKFLPNQAK